MNDKINKLMILGERDIRAFDVAQSLRRIPGRIEEARRQLEFEEQQLAEVKDPWELLEREIQEREA
ncbi:MAG: hypothetical protein OEZ59_01420, partial [Deltaproteobacteria bacterium]|nr:hypothetical protein [Deltaproteobacteria bacterium]